MHCRYRRDRRARPGPVGATGLGGLRPENRILIRAMRWEGFTSQTDLQIEGAAATISPDVLRALAHEFDLLRSLLIRHEQVLLAQAHSRPVAMRATRSKHVCVDGFCVC